MPVRRNVLALSCLLGVGVGGCLGISPDWNPLPFVDTDAGTDGTDGGPGFCGDGIVQDDEACDDGNATSEDDCVDCTAAICGDSFVQTGVEECDDGDANPNDGCEADCTFTRGVRYIATGGRHSCALMWEGTVKCWGANDFGQLGQGNTESIGDDETPDTIPLVDVGDTVRQIAAGANHTCAVLAGDFVRCWGAGADGRLGYANEENIGDDETPADMPPVDVGDDVGSMILSSNASCARQTNGRLRCWGDSLAYGNTEKIGDDEPPSAVGEVAVGNSNLLYVSGGREHFCVVHINGDVRCWGANDSGQLGQGHTDPLGANETPAEIPPVELGEGDIRALATGEAHNCVLFSNGNARCWGSNSSGQLGLGHTDNVGDDELPIDESVVNIGAEPDFIAAGARNTCAVRFNGLVKCWGEGQYGANGNSSIEDLGDDEVPNDFVYRDLGVELWELASGVSQGHFCYAVTTNAARCWGRGEFGALGYGSTENIGDDEFASEVTDVPL